MMIAWVALTEISCPGPLWTSLKRWSQREQQLRTAITRERSVIFWSLSTGVYVSSPVSQSATFSPRGNAEAGAQARNIGNLTC